MTTLILNFLLNTSIINITYSYNNRRHRNKNIGQSLRYVFLVRKKYWRCALLTIKQLV